MGESGSHFSLFDFTACFEWEGKVPDAVFFSVGDSIYFYFWKVFVTAFTASTLEQIIHGLMESFVLQNILLADYYVAFHNIETLPHQVFLDDRFCHDSIQAFGSSADLWDYRE